MTNFLKTKNTWLIDLFYLSIYVVLLFGFMLGVRALSVPDEARYTEIPREMLFFHDFITPHLDGIKYFEKPPLLYWIQAGTIALFGINEWALRIPTALMGLIGCLATYSVGRFLFNRYTGIASALILVTSPLYFAMAHSITLDMTVSLWITISLYAFISAVHLPVGSHSRFILCCVMYVAIALAILSKGLIGLLLPGMVIFSWMLLLNRWKEIPALHVVIGLLILLVVTVPWHILVQLKNQEFFQFYFVDQQFLRYLTKDLGRYKPMWWFIPVLALGFFPWVIFLLQLLWRRWSLKSLWVNRQHYATTIFFLLWVVEIFIFFSISKSKLIPYILPVLPALAILLSLGFTQKIKNAQHHTTSLLNSRSSAIMGWCWICLAVGAWGSTYWAHQFSSLALAHIHGLALIWLIGGIGLLVMRFEEFLTLRFAWVVLIQSIWLWGLVMSVPQFDHRPIKNLALQLKKIAKPEDIVASYGLYYQDLPVYLGRLVLIINWKNELAFGYAHQDSAKTIMLDQEAFWRLWESPKHVFAVMDDSDYQTQKQHHHLMVLAQHDDDWLVANY